jgi:GTP-binding protein EngB required for normal cell division
MNFQPFYDATEFLGDSDTEGHIRTIQELSDNKRFLLTVWGHYSAGKSRFLNAIIGKDVLPAQSMETTAVLTYIQYANVEHAELVTVDGDVVNVSVEYVNKLFQNSDDDVRSKLESLKYINVYVNCDLLKTGLVLVDTPGVNTLIEKHQELAASAIESSGKILYILGGTPSATDKDFITRITSVGVDISFIRTKCDKFNTSEENPRESIAAERALVERILGHNVDYIGVSALREYTEWYGALDEVRTMLKRLAENLDAELTSRCVSRLALYRDKLVKLLSETQSELTLVADGNKAALEEKRARCADKIANLERVLANKEIGIKRRIDNATHLLKTQMPLIVGNSAKRFSNEIDLLPKTNLEHDINAVCETFLRNGVARLQSEFDSELSEVVQGIQTEILDAADIKTLPEPPSFSDVVRTNIAELDTLKAKMQSLKNELEHSKEQREHLADGVDDDGDNQLSDAEYDAAIAEIEVALAEIPNGVAMRVSDNQPMQASSIMRKVGDVADWILLLLPGKAVATIASKALKGLSKLPNGAKIISRVAKIANKTDKFKDMIFAGTKFAELGKGYRWGGSAASRLAGRVGQIHDMAKGVQPALTTGDVSGEPTSVFGKIGKVLDVFSIGHWTEKIGAAFDKPPVMEVDTDEMARREQLRNEIITEQQRLSSERIKKKEQLGLLKSAQKRLEIEAEEKRICLEEAERLYRKQVDELEKKAKAMQISSFKANYVEYYQSQLSAIADKMFDGYLSHAEQNIAMYVAQQGGIVTLALESERTRFNELLNITDGNEVTEKLLQCGALINNLQAEV